MQILESYRQELRATYRARITERFANARRCLVRARRARQNGDGYGHRKWLTHARILWRAGAAWRLRAQSLVLVSAWLLSLTGCANTESTMTLVIVDEPDGTVEWQVSIPEATWRGLQPEQIDARTFELDRDTSGTLISVIDDELARKHLCPRNWTFGPGFLLKNGTQIFTGHCDGRLVQG